MWEDDTKVQEVRKLFAPSLTDLEFGFFVGMGKATNLNPFLREIWAVKYDKSQAAQIFIGRDGYRKAAQGHPEYDFHQSDAVYENDKFEVINGDVKHSYKLTNRGKLIGAYCIAKRHKSSRPIYVFAELGEYSTGRSLWDAAKGKPATMIKKVAESQCLRACFQDLLGGTYGEEEMIERSSRQSLKEGNPSKSNQLMDKLKQAKGQTIDVEPEAEQETGEIATTDQLKEVHALLAVKDFNKDRLTGALGHYNVETLAQLTAQQADDFINQLNKIADK
ncbi:MAG TPA: phage recombination protein Bet [Flavitalea sp.]|nr:phage recombination protein Bet [Flavitalea sp.]